MLDSREAFQLSAYRMQHDRVLETDAGHVVEFGFESENQTGIKALNALMERLQIAAALGKASRRVCHPAGRDRLAPGCTRRYRIP